MKKALIKSLSRYAQCSFADVKEIDNHSIVALLCLTRELAGKILKTDQGNCDELLEETRLKVGNILAFERNDARIISLKKRSELAPFLRALEWTVLYRAFEYYLCQEMKEIVTSAADIHLFLSAQKITGFDSEYAEIIRPNDENEVTDDEGRDEYHEPTVKDLAILRKAVLRMKEIEMQESHSEKTEK